VTVRPAEPSAGSVSLDNGCRLVPNDPNGTPGQRTVYLLNPGRHLDDEATWTALRDADAVPLALSQTAQLASTRFCEGRELAAAATGAAWIGVLRVDVDHLGRLFTVGLPPEKRSFARLSALSRRLNRFFKVHLDEICAGRLAGMEPHRFLPEASAGARSVSVIHAGGDEVCLVGAWDDVTELAADIAWTFGRYIGQNPDVTLSGGLAMGPPERPLYLLARWAAEAEDVAKHAGRGRFTPFHAANQSESEGDPLGASQAAFPWPDVYHRWLPLVRALAAFGELAERSDGKKRLQWAHVSRGFLYRLREIVATAPSRKQWPPLHFFSTLVREVRSFRPSRPAAWQELMVRLQDPQNFPYLPAALEFVDLLTQGEAGDKTR
jgi:CRISPR-associated protein Csm1